MPKFLSSVFVKLFAIILVAGIGINLILILFIGAFRHHVTTAYEPHLARYIDYLVKEIGDPPDVNQAKRIATATAMKIIYDSANLQWSTHQHNDFVHQKRFRYMRFQDGRIRVGSYHGNHVVYVNHNEGRFVFYLPRAPGVENKLKRFGFCLLFGITLLLFIVYVAIRRVLKPLHGLKKGVDHVARGQLSHRVPVSGCGELSELSQSFNTMTQRLGQLIKAKERLILDVSHELRSPLTRMNVALAMFPESSGKQSIREDIQEMEKKITELLDTARTIGVKAELKLIPTDVSHLLHKIVAAFGHRPPGIHMGEFVQISPITIDPQQMEKVFKNIIDNGLKYSAKASPPLTLSLGVDEKNVVVTITDGGIGIPREDLGFIFEPFYRVDPSRSQKTGGYGLGLSLAKTIVDAHGGRIEVQSTVGEGTTVRILLPMFG